MHFVDFEVEQILNKAKRRDPLVKNTQMATKCKLHVICGSDELKQKTVFGLFGFLDRKLEKAKRKPGNESLILIPSPFTVERFGGVNDLTPRYFCM